MKFQIHLCLWILFLTSTCSSSKKLNEKMYHLNQSDQSKKIDSHQLMNTETQNQNIKHTTIDVDYTPKVWAIKRALDMMFQQKIAKNIDAYPLVWNRNFHHRANNDFVCELYENFYFDTSRTGYVRLFIYFGNGDVPYANFQLSEVIFPIQSKVLHVVFDEGTLSQIALGASILNSLGMPLNNLYGFIAYKLTKTPDHYQRWSYNVFDPDSSHWFKDFSVERNLLESEKKSLPTALLIKEYGDQLIVLSADYDHQNQQVKLRSTDIVDLEHIPTNLTDHQKINILSYEKVANPYTKLTGI